MRAGARKDVRRRRLPPRATRGSRREKTRAGMRKKRGSSNGKTQAEVLYAAEEEQAPRPTVPPIHPRYGAPATDVRAKNSASILRLIRLIRPMYEHAA